MEALDGQPMRQIRLEVDFEQNPHLMKSFPELFKEGSTLITREAPVEPASPTSFIGYFDDDKKTLLGA